MNILAFTLLRPNFRSLRFGLEVPKALKNGCQRQISSESEKIPTEIRRKAELHRPQWQICDKWLDHYPALIDKSVECNVDMSFPEHALAVIPGICFPNNSVYKNKITLAPRARASFLTGHRLNLQFFRN